jgi:hypothetical protein
MGGRRRKVSEPDGKAAAKRSGARVQIEEKEGGET